FRSPPEAISNRVRRSGYGGRGLECRRSLYGCNQGTHARADAVPGPERGDAWRCERDHPRPRLRVPPGRRPDDAMAHRRARPGRRGAHAPLTTTWLPAANGRRLAACPASWPPWTAPLPPTTVRPRSTSAPPSCTTGSEEPNRRAASAAARERIARARSATANERGGAASGGVPSLGPPDAEHQAPR